MPFVGPGNLVSKDAYIIRYNHRRIAIEKKVSEQLRRGDPTCLCKKELILSDLTHLERIRQELPATRARIYLNAGTFGPLPNCVAHALQERTQAEWQAGRLGRNAFERMFAIYTDAREHVARLLN